MNKTWISDTIWTSKRWGNNNEQFTSVKRMEWLWMPKTVSKEAVWLKWQQIITRHHRYQTVWIPPTATTIMGPIAESLSTIIKSVLDSLYLLLLQMETEPQVSKFNNNKIITLLVTAKGFLQIYTGTARNTELWCQWSSSKFQPVSLEWPYKPSTKTKVQAEVLSQASRITR